MEKRVLLAVVLSFIVLYTYQALFPPAPVQPEPTTQTPGAPAKPGVEGPPQPGAAIASPAPPPETPAVEGALPTTAAEAEQEIVVESPAVHAVFSNRGGVLKTWRLKGYRNEKGEPLDLVPSAVEGADRPFTLDSPESSAGASLRSGLFKPSAQRLTIGAEGATLRFELKDASGLAARKEYSFSAAQPFVIRFTAVVTRDDKPVPTTVRWGPALGTGVIGTGMNYNPPPQPVFSRGRKVTRLGFDQVPEQRVQEGTFDFAGVDDHYFLSAVVTDQPIRIEFEPVHLPGGAGKGLQFVAWSARFATGPQNTAFFFGPKDFDQLKAVGPEFTLAIDFGMFRWLVVPLLNALKWVNGYLGNYGWSIIALTILINLAMFPLRHKSVVSMRRMQELQPEVKAIQERYAKLKMSDPARQKMNVELMNLYRERGVNPASGCVPMLLTLPVLFAFYAMLSVAIELRGAPFVGWIRDLSVHDPYFVTPILMGITMVVQQKMTPSTADPMQQKMMMFMPIIFTFMFIWAPSGLVLYWTVSNLWAIGQQAITNRLIGPPVVHAARPPAERRVKNVGAGRSPQAAKERK